MSIYGYLRLSDLLHTISMLSKTERTSIQNSHIVNRNRQWICKYWQVNSVNKAPIMVQRQECLNHGDRIGETLRKVNFLLSMVECVSIRIDSDWITTQQ